MLRQLLLSGHVRSCLDDVWLVDIVPNPASVCLCLGDASHDTVWSVNDTLQVSMAMQNTKVPL